MQIISITCYSSVSMSGLPVDHITRSLILNVYFQANRQFQNYAGRLER
jgi:hypothetical protein